VMVNTVDCFAERYSVNMHLALPNTRTPKSYRAAVPGPGILSRLATAVWRACIITAAFFLSSILAAAQLWSYTVYVIPAAGKLAFSALERFNAAQNVVSIATVAPWVASDNYLYSNTIALAITTWAILPTLLITAAGKWYGGAPELPVILHAVTLAAEAYTLISLRTRWAVQYFPRLFAIGFYVTNGYAMAFDYNGYWGTAAVAFAMWVVAWAAYFWLVHEIPAIYAGRLAASKPREFNFPVVLGMNNGAAPSLYGLIQFRPALRLHYTETGRMLIRSSQPSRLRPGVWHDETAPQNIHQHQGEEDRESEQEEDQAQEENQPAGDGSDGVENPEQQDEAFARHDADDSLSEEVQIELQDFSSNTTQAGVGVEHLSGYGVPLQEAATT